MERTAERGTDVEIYSPGARRFHWWVVLLVLIQLPLGIFMAHRGNVLNIWDDTTNRMYSLHKLLGITIFVVVLLRLLYRLAHGKPADEPTITWWQRGASHMNHWLLYLVLLAMPVVGYIGISQYPALDIFGYPLPGLVAQNQNASEVAFLIHWYLAIALMALIAIHFLAAMFHYLIRRDNVLTRMLPSMRRR